MEFFYKGIDMKKAPESMDRRDFNKLLSAAVTGMFAGGALSGCKMGGEAVDGAVSDVNVCKGLNACKGKGAGGGNECAGKGECATAAKHSCHGKNECKGQGGCGEAPGMNACSGKGECAVPLKKAAWDKARKNFDAKMKKQG